MNPPPVVRLAHPDDWADWRLLRQRSLAEDPDAFSSSTSMWSGSNDTEQRWRDRLVAGACFLAYDGSRPVGMVAGQVVEGGTQLISMWVAPEARRRGVGRELIDRVVEWSAGRPLKLRVMDGNEAALRAYENHGFVLHDGCADDEGCRRMVHRP